MKRWLRLTLLALAGIVAAPVLLLLAALLMLQTETGQDWLSATLSRQFSTPDSTLTITGLRGSPPFDFSVAEIRLADRDGTWLEIARARLAIEPRTLLHGELTVRRLRAQTVSLSRLPAASPSPAAPATGQPLRLEPPHLPVAVTINEVAVDRLALAEPVLGQAAALTFAADARLAGGSAAAHLSLQRIDQIAGSATLALRLAGRPARLELDAEVSEPTGRLMARVLQRPDFQPFSASLKGVGPVVDWHGKLAASVGSVLQLQADLHLAQPAEYRLFLEGEARQANLLPAKLQPVIGERVRFSARAAFGDGDRVSLDHLTLTAAAGTLSAAAALDNGTQELSGNAKLDVPDLALAGALAGAPLAGHLQIDAAMQGSVMEPVLKLDITGEGGRYATYGIEKLEAKLNLTGQAAGPRTRWGIDAHCHLAGLGRDGQALPARLGEAIDLTVAGILDPADRSMALDGFTVTGAGLDLAAAGHLSPDSSNGTLMLQVAELRRFGGLAGLPGLKGHLSIDANVTSDPAAKVTATLRGKAEEFATGIPAADALLGSRVDLTAEAARNEDGGLVLSQLGVSATGLMLEASGTESAAPDRLAGNFKLRVPRLSALGTPLGTQVQGALELAGELGGSLAKPSLRAKLVGSGIGGAEPLAQQLAFTLDLPDLRAPTGRLTGTINGTDRVGKLSGRIEASFARRAADRLRISPLVVIGGARLAGDIDYSMVTGRAAGKLGGSVADLRPWSRLAGTPLAGRAELALTLGSRGGQSADLKLTGSGLALGTGPQALRLGRLAVAGQGRNLTAKPNGSLTVDLSDVAAGNLRLARANIQATPRPAGAIAFNGSADGTLLLQSATADQNTAPIRLALAGDWSQAKGLQRITLSRLDGALGPDQAKLRRPVQATFGARDLRIADLALDIAGGHLSGEAALTGDQLSIKLAGRRLSLAPVGRITGRSTAGTLDLAADLHGPVTAPQGQVKLAGRGLRFSGAPADAGLPPLGVDLSIIPGGGQLAVKGAVAIGKTRLVALDGTVPVQITARPLTIALPRDRALALRINGDGRLETLAELLPLGEDRVAGHYRVALTIDGTPASPEAGGTLTIQDGSYANQAFGTELKGVAAELVGDRGRLRLVSLTARDGQTGRLSASGTANLTASPSPVLDMEAKLTRFLVANSDQARATADAEIRVSGSVAAPKLTARIRVPRGEFRIPDKLPPSVVTLNVVEIDSRDPSAARRELAEAEQRKAAPANSTLPIALDVQVDIPGQTFVRGRGLDSEWRGKIAVAGDSGQPEITGGLEAVRGTQDLLGKTFVIQRGKIEFPTGSLADPRIDLLAEYDASDITAQVELTGRPTSPKLTLSSKPQLPQDEVLSRVLFGSDVAHISAAEGLQLAYAAQSMTSGGPGILDRLRNTFGLDRLSLGNSSSNSPNMSLPQSSINPIISPTPGSSGTSTSQATSAAVSGGKYVAPGVFVGVDQGATTQSTRVKVEVEVSRHVSAYSSVGANSSSQLGVNWRYDY